MKFTISSLSPTLFNNISKNDHQASPKSSLEKVYDILSDVEAYPQWLQPITKATEIFRVGEEGELNLASSKDGMISHYFSQPTPLGANI